MRPLLFRGAMPIIPIIATVAVILILNVPVLNAGLKNAFYFVTAPLQQNVWIAGARLNGFAGYFADAGGAAAEKEKLREQLNGLIAISAQAEEIRKENDFLRRGLGLELNRDFDLKLADIVAKNIADDSIVINKGLKNGIIVGMPVITSGKAVVGRISKLYDNFSEVQLATSRDFSFDVKIGDERIDGLIKGRGGLEAGIDLVPKDKIMEPGAMVFTSRMGGIFPADLVMGTIKDVNKNDTGMFQSASIDLAFDIRGAERVFVVNEKFSADTGIIPPDANIK